MNIAKRTGKALVLLLLAYAFFIAYTYSVPFVQDVVPIGEGSALASVVGIAGLQSIALACLWGLVFALPFALLWGRFAYLAALFCVAPVVGTVLVLALQKPGRLILLAVVCYFIVCLIVVVPLAAHLAHRWLERRSRGTMQA